VVTEPGLLGAISVHEQHRSEERLPGLYEPWEIYNLFLLVVENPWKFPTKLITIEATNHQAT
jgi:hypothetical protein